MIRARILSENENPVRLFEILQCYAAFPDTDHFVKRGAARFVTHVRTVRQVIRAELAGKELVEKRGLVTGAAARVKRRRVRCRERLQFARHLGERLITFVWLV